MFKKIEIWILYLVVFLGIPVTIKLVNIEKPYDFEFKESKKDISLNIDKELRAKAMSLYSDLNDLNLM